MILTGEPAKINYSMYFNTHAHTHTHTHCNATNIVVMQKEEHETNDCTTAVA